MDSLLNHQKKRFTESSIKRIQNLNLDNFTITNNDFVDFINITIDKINNEKSIMFIDPPYYLENKSKLYGLNGDLHEHFSHNKLYDIIKVIKCDWIMTYNNCDYIKTLYKNFTIIETNWTYGMNKSKKSSEIIILSILKS